MKSRFDYVPPAGRRLMLSFVRRFDPAKQPGFPYEAVIAEPARWPTGSGWQRRRRWAAPLRAVAGMIEAAAAFATRPLYRVATVIEGQPLVWWCEMEGWRERRGRRHGHWRTWWEFEGEITPTVRLMYAEHPDWFADSAPEVLEALGAVQQP